MLGKLLKHEFSATARTLLPLYLVLAATAAVGRVTLASGTEAEGVAGILNGLLIMVYIFSIIAVAVATMIVMIQRFYKNLMGDEGYLMFTLPVRTGSLIQAKLITSATWLAASILLVIASVFAIALTPQEIAQIPYLIGQITSHLQYIFGSSTLFLVQVGIIIMLSLFFSTLMIYTSIAIGQLFGKHKLIGAFGAYMGINLLIQFAATALMGALGLLLRFDMSDLSILPLYVFPIVIVLMLVVIGLFYAATHYILKNKLNLE